MRTGLSKDLAVLLVVWSLSGLYATHFVYRGWIPHDDGTLAQSAERVLQGDMPHRDFDDVYTGGLTYLHAAAMRVFGVNLRALRFVIFGAFLLFVPICYAMARYVAPPLVAALATLVGVAWGIPNYFASMPSWYNLVLAMLGGLALIRFVETNRRAWLYAAGACGGVSVLAKIVGLYYLAGGLLFLAYLEQIRAAVPRTDWRRPSSFWPVVAVPCTVFLWLLWTLLSSRAGATEWIVFFAPPCVLCLFVLWGEWTTGTSDVPLRTRRLLGLVIPFTVGAALPIVLFMIPFWRAHAADALFRDVFVLTGRRLVESSRALPPAVTLVLGVPYALLVVADRPSPARKEWMLTAVLAAALGLALVFGGTTPVYSALWASVRSLPLIAAIAAVWTLARRPAGFSAIPHSRELVFLFVAIASTITLVQFPYPVPVYFCYAAPMVVLALLAVVSVQPAAPRRLHATVAVFFLLFAMLWVNRSYAWNLGVKYLPYPADSFLDVERGRLWVSAADKHDYEGLVRAIEQRAGGGALFAGPDCPEVYFLAGHPNPTRAIFDFLTPGTEDAQWMTRLLADGGVRVAVINTAPLFSPPLDRAVESLLVARFPHAETIGRFVVRWGD